MARHIDADALKDELELADFETDSRMFGGQTVLFEDSVFKIVDSAPTISTDDVRGVVHCKDCKWCHAGYCEKYDDIIPWGCANKPWEDWFCADGKRREMTKEAQDAD